MAGYRADVTGLLTRLAVYVLLGTIINLAVAWGCAAWSEPPGFDAFLTADLRQQRWETEERRPQLKSDQLWIVRAYRSKGLRIIVIRHQPPERRLVHVHRAGWPTPAFEGRAINPKRGKAGQIIDASYFAAFPLPTKKTAPGTTATSDPMIWRSGRVLPVLPIWPGFAINTTLYALAAMTITGLWWIARRGIRRVRGRCLACAYDLRRDYSTGCPECGWRRAEPTAMAAA